MPNNTYSIEDLIDPTSVKGDNDNVYSKLSDKQEEIKIKEIERLTQKNAKSAGRPYINLIGFSISPEALSLIKEEEAKNSQAVCFFYDGGNIRIAIADPDNSDIGNVIEKIKKKYRLDPMVYLVSSHSLNYALELYRTLPKVEKRIMGVKITEDDLNKYSGRIANFQDLQKEIAEITQVTEIVTIIIAAAVKARSSDIHIEGEEMGIKVRYRIDGVLHDVATLEKNIWEKIISRLKILTGVKINVSDKPQDGRMSIYMANDRIDVRASFLPTSFGESVVMRLLMSGTVGLDFEDLGLMGTSYGKLKREVERPNGMIVTTGPTGSGKTTTLYSILKKLNDSETKIITIEDPIEYQLKGVNQSQVGKNYTFAQGLRSIVRQDPDVLMVGEIRDLETAEIAIQAALTGHLVLSTIHTNDAAGTVPRFLSMGVKPYLLAPALNAMIGQRLVRKICAGCKEEIRLDETTTKRVNELLDTMPAAEKEKIDMKNLKFYAGKGCEACQGIGFKGQIGIYEIMVMNADIEKLILSNKVSEYDMRENAASAGMVTMVQDGLLKAIAGITSIDEVFRVAE
jgi:type II secretory ATPase GspE/PulE/Tfp pilus assembly ATPase PilB-like protein